MRQWEIAYRYEHPYDATFDQDCMFTCQANSEEAAIAAFREDHPSSPIQFVREKS